MASFAPVARDQGFDPASGTFVNPWQAVFLDDITRVRLVGGKNHRFRVEPPASPDVTWGEADNPLHDGSRIVLLNGFTSGGHVTLVAFDPASTSPSPSDARLDIDVLETAKISVRFFSLIDSAGRQSKRTLASMRQVLADAAMIHGPQDGVIFDLQGLQDMRLTVDLGSTVSSANCFSQLQQLFDSGAPDPCGANFNVFLVWSVETDEKNVHSGRQSTLATTLRNMCLFEDFGLAPGPVLAHELGHFLQGSSLSGNGHHPSRDNLMFKFSPSGKHLDRNQCRIMNANARNGSLLIPACTLPLPPDLAQ